MDMNLTKPIVFFLFLLTISGLWAAESPKYSPSFVDHYFPDCGTYEIVGRLFCKKAKCQYTVFEKSQDEMTLDLTGDYKFISEHFNNKLVKSHLEVTKLKTHPMTASFAKDELPLRVLPNEIEHFILLKKQPCSEK